MNTRNCTALILGAAWLLASSSCQPVTREKPEWYILDTYQEAIAEFRTLSVRIARLAPSGIETGLTAQVILARPNLARVETRDSQKITSVLISDGKRLTGTGQSGGPGMDAPTDLKQLDLSDFEETAQWGVRLLVDPALILDLQQIETTTETVDGSEVVRVSGTEIQDGREAVPVSVWISPDTGLPVKYSRREKGGSLVLAFERPAIDTELAPDAFILR